MAKLRINLRGLLILVTAVVLFLGYGQYRRQWILKVCAELEKDAYVFQIPNECHDSIWQRKPSVGIVVHGIDGRERLQIWRGRRASFYATFDDQEGFERLKTLGMVQYEKER
jgi:hypothetical protein